MTNDTIGLEMTTETELNDGWLAEYASQFENDPEYLAETLAIRFTEQILSLMKQEGVSRAALAEKLEVTRAYISKVFNAPPNLTLRSIATVALGLDADVAITVTPRSVTAAFPSASAVSWLKAAAVLDASSLPSNSGAAGAHVAIPFVRLDTAVGPPEAESRSPGPARDWSSAATAPVQLARSLAELS